MITLSVLICLDQGEVREFGGALHKALEAARQYDCLRHAGDAGVQINISKSGKNRILVQFFRVDGLGKLNIYLKAGTSGLAVVSTQHTCAHRPWAAPDGVNFTRFFHGMMTLYDLDEGRGYDKMRLAARCWKGDKAESTENMNILQYSFPPYAHVLTRTLVFDDMLKLVHARPHGF